MNAAVTNGEDKSANKADSRDEGESGRNTGGGTGHDVPPVAQPMTGSDTPSAGIKAPVPDDPDAASSAGSGASTQAIVQPAADGAPASEAPPRRRRGILLGTGAGAAAPAAAADDAKSLSWMASQAVKAAKAVKASQQEQAQAWKAEAGTSEDEPPRLAEDDDIALARQNPAQSFPREQPASTETARAGEEYPGAPRDSDTGLPAPGPLPVSLSLEEATVTGQSPGGQTVQPVEPSLERAANPRMPASPRRAAASLVPVRMALMLGVLAMFSYAGYRYWSAGERTASEVPASASAIIEPAGPAEEAELMTPPAISVVAAPQQAGGSTRPEAPAIDTGTTPMPAPAASAQSTTTTSPGEPAAEEINLMTPPPVSVAPAPEPAPEHPIPPAVEAGVPPKPESATGKSPPTVGAVPQPAPAEAAAVTMPKTWYPSAVPGAPSPALEADTAAGQQAPSTSPAAEPELTTDQPASPSSPSPVVETGVAADQQAPSSSPAVSPEMATGQPTAPSSSPPAVETGVPARPATPTVPATRPRYPANGYGYRQPPASWQPYYRPVYPQAPARQ